MAARTRMQLVPSTGVLIGAIVAAVLAAVLVNVYIGSVENRYTEGAFYIYVLKEPIKEGQPLLPARMKEVRVPAVFREAFDKAMKPGDEEMFKEQTAPRDMKEGQPIFYGDLYPEAIAELRINPRRGYDLVTIPVQADSSPGQQLQPGGYVRIYAVFNDAPPESRTEDLKMVEVIRNVQVRAVDGSSRPIPADKRSPYDSISILVTKDQAEKLGNIRLKMFQKDFIVHVTHRPEQMEELEPEINTDVLKYLEPSRLTAPAPPRS